MNGNRDAGANGSNRRILIVAPCPFPFDRGTPIRVERLARLMASDFEVHVACYHQGREETQRFKMHRIPRLPFDMTRAAGPSFGKIVSDVFLFFLIMRLVRREGFRAIDGHLHEGALLGLATRAFSGVKVAYNAHGTLSDELVSYGILRSGSISYRVFRRIEDGIERSCDVIIAQSVMRREQYLAKGLDPRRVIAVEDAPLFEDYRPRDSQHLKASLGLGARTIFLYSGELKPYQGIDLLLEAFARAVKKRTDLTLLLVGRPRAPYDDHIANLGLEDYVHVLDDVPFEKLPDYLSLADVLLAPRLSGSNVPGKLPIYMAAGKAIIGTDTIGINTVLRHGETGWLVEPTPESLEDALLRLAADTSLRTRLGAAAHSDARERYDPERIRAAMTAAYEILLEET